MMASDLATKLCAELTSSALAPGRLPRRNQGGVGDARERVRLPPLARAVRPAQHGLLSYLSPAPHVKPIRPNSNSNLGILRHSVILSEGEARVEGPLRS